jgi:hypothetical protein
MYYVLLKPRLFPCTNIINGLEVYSLRIVNERCFEMEVLAALAGNSVAVFLQTLRIGFCTFMLGVGCIGLGSKGVREASCLRSQHQRTRVTTKEVAEASSRTYVMLMSLFSLFVGAQPCSRLPMISASSSNALFGTSVVCSCRWPLNSIGARTRLSYGPKLSSATPAIRTGPESWSLKKRLGT